MELNNQIVTFRRQDWVVLMKIDFLKINLCRSIIPVFFIILRNVLYVNIKRMFEHENFESD